jgi:aryl-alcohol dehydrogenase-like predicted oxidoreductase
MREKMKRTLGKSGIEVSALGLGCWAIGGPWMWVGVKNPYPAGWGEVDDDESIRAIHAAMDHGITFFDTAANYGAGHSEKVLGKALVGKRDQVVIATKFGHLVNEEAGEVQSGDDQILGNVKQDCENSLRRLGTDYIDIYQLHEGGYNPELAPQVRDVLEELVKEGKIKAYGWSTDLPDRARIFAEGEHCTSIQFALNVFLDNPEMRQVCKENNLGGINKSPLSRGILTGKFDSETVFPENDIRKFISFKDGLGADRLEKLEQIRDIMTANGHSLAQASLAYIWALDERMVPIPGIRTVAQAEENAKTMELGPLSQEQMSQIAEILGDRAGEIRGY